jgi:hypothetical protein
MLVTCTARSKRHAPKSQRCRRKPNRELKNAWLQYAGMLPCVLPAVIVTPPPYLFSTASKKNTHTHKHIKSDRGLKFERFVAGSHGAREVDLEGVEKHRKAMEDAGLVEEEDDDEDDDDDDEEEEEGEEGAEEEGAGKGGEAL